MVVLVNATLPILPGKLLPAPEAARPVMFVMLFLFQLQAVPLTLFGLVMNIEEKFPVL